jgi:uncharacterized protein YgbK (DUF1537 family)
VEAAQSVFSKDPFTPVTRSAVADIIHSQADTPTENISSDAYEKAAVKPDRKTIRIFDAESMEDIEALSVYLKRGNYLEMLAGCAGFAEILPALLELPTRGLTWEKSAGNILVVSGSVNPATVEQITYGETLGFSIFTLSLEQKLDAHYTKSPDCDDFVRRVKNELERSGRVIVRTVENPAEMELSERYAHSNGLSKNAIVRRVADNIGEITLHILKEASVGNLAVFGGDTLHGILSKMRCAGVSPLAEISPGVVAAKTLSEHHKGILITKSGGLGDKDVLRQIVNAIKGLKESA